MSDAASSAVIPFFLFAAKAFTASQLTVSTVAGTGNWAIRRPSAAGSRGRERPLAVAKEARSTFAASTCCQHWYACGTGIG